MINRPCAGCASATLCNTVDYMLAAVGQQQAGAEHATQSDDLELEWGFNNRMIGHDLNGVRVVLYGLANIRHIESLFVGNVQLCVCLAKNLDLVLIVTGTRVTGVYGGNIRSSVIPSVQR